MEYTWEYFALYSWNALLNKRSFHERQYILRLWWRNNKKISKCGNHVRSLRKIDCPERIQTTWMDDFLSVYMRTKCIQYCTVLTGLRTMCKTKHWTVSQYMKDKSSRVYRQHIENTVHHCKVFMNKWARHIFVFISKVIALHQKSDVYKWIRK